MNLERKRGEEYNQKDLKDNNSETEKILTEEEILDSNDVELIAKYAKENRSKAAINKVRELLELSRDIGEKVVQNFFNSFKECGREKTDYLDFENTESGKLALDLLEKMPEPFKTNASKKLESYKKGLKYNTELFKKHKNNPEKIWKEIFSFDYYNIPDFKERFWNFLFKDIKAISDKFYKVDALKVKQDPFAVTFFIENQTNFDRVYSKKIKDAHDKIAGFSEGRDRANINVIKINKPKTKNIIDNNTTHELEHAIHRNVNLLEVTGTRFLDLATGTFDNDKGVVNNEMRLFYQDSLKRAKDEIFAFQKDGTAKEQVQKFLFYKIKDALFKERGDSTSILDEIRDPNHLYDYNEELREANYKWIELSKTLLDTEKQKLNEAINFLQSEYDRVLKNMIDVIYEENQSVEFFRNVPINELWKYSNGKYNRTDFIIRKFKF